MAHQHARLPQSLAPICRHLLEASLYCKGAPLASQSRILRWDLRKLDTGMFVWNILRLTFDNRINRAALLAQTTVYALGHINVISRGPSAPVHTLFSLDCDGLSRANGFAQLASNTALLARRVPSQGVFTSKAG